MFEEKEEVTERVVHRVPVDKLASKPFTVSLHMIVKNGESVIARTIGHVLPYVNQVRIVLNDTDDETLWQIIETIIRQGKNVIYDVQHVTAASHPELYISDIPSTYSEAGPTLSGEEFNGPYTMLPLLFNWSVVRNLGWESKADYRLQLDADDLLEKPESLPLACKAMAEMDADLAASQYKINNSRRVVYRERLARSTPLVRWEGHVHDQLLGGLRRILFEDLLTTVDMRDSRGTGTRIVGRDFKALYYLARKNQWHVSLRHYLYLIQESRFFMPIEWVAGPLFERYCQEFDECGSASRLPEKAWACTLIGEFYETRNRWDEAAAMHTKSIDAHPTRNGYWRLARTLHQSARYEECIRAYQHGFKCDDIGSVLDLISISEPATQVLVADAYSCLGKHTEAMALVAKLGTPRFLELPGVVAFMRVIKERKDAAIL
jgi:glycosyltransferase involved in cell wall biosynthesis